MSWYRRNWYWVGGGVAAVALVYLGVEWRDLSVVQRILLANFALLALHEFEEYGWPGGEPAIMNKVIQPSDLPDRYPLNQNSAMIVNVVAAYPWLFAAFLFPDQIWLGLSAVLFWIGQFGVHIILTNKKLGTVYNPGELTCLAGIGLLVYYVYEVESTDLASLWDWVFAVITLALFVAVVMMKLTYTWLADRNSPYPFTPEEMSRFGVDAKLADRARA